MQRRTFLGGTAAALSAAALPDVAMARSGEPEKVVVCTSAGRVAGARAGRLAVFRGVPFAQPPVGALRFASPRPPVHWDGVRDATKFAPPSFQAVLPGSSEDGLYANIWTPDTRGSRPVLVYIHGGGWKLGAGSLPTYDGAKLSERGDVVVVNFNYRLGPFGWGEHDDLTDDRTGSRGNWGLQDQVALLKWVKENAPVFGGDPSNITLVGTSAGGASTWQLSLLPELNGILRRIVPISACHVWNPANTLTPADSRVVYEAMARQFGTTVRGLRDVAAAKLQQAWDTIFGGDPTTRLVASGREYRGPIRDGRWLPGYDYESQTPAIPVLSIHTSTEGSFYTDSDSPQPDPRPVPTTDAELKVRVREFLAKGAAQVTDAQVNDCVAAYRAAAAADGLPGTPLSIWTEVWGDGLFRYQIVRLAERHVRRRHAPLYLMEFAHPVRPPFAGTPHEATSKFLFGTHGLPENRAKFGDGPLERTVSDTFVDFVASFAHTGVPRAAAAPAWPAFTTDRHNTMILGGDAVARVAETPKLRQLRYWDDAGWVPRT
ncbi:carboxylesterase family protein [Kibdelosporangium phytohabitans]|uniref:Carboxylic ester hydrolase n=1 Tax=Kibdelosporangium phytohabitans TaxID=860235 RepID=A0A0N7F3W1_9PSEU|nr:carboxylesterase family protein [Kibdelosporangium phytohabitans]ALG09735.1 carboxylesterase [Kibdelosporangium phytohabitans]MBE1468900.1 para-nitrobenzyl esterase [Kibdelosporangium phytohabitans]